MDELNIGNIGIVVKKKNIKNMYIRVLPPDGKVQITAPNSTSDDAIRMFAVSRISWIKKQRKNFEEQAYKREYMFWYNRVKKLEKNHAPQEQIQSAKAALKQFRKEAVERKNQIQNGKLSTMQFMNWMIGQEPIIQKICGE